MGLETNYLNVTGDAVITGTISASNITNLNILNVLDYGIVYNDDTSEVKAANYAAWLNILATQKETGAIIRFPNGGKVYFGSNTITFPAYGKIIGGNYSDPYRNNLDTSASLNSVELIVDAVAGDDDFRIEDNTFSLDDFHIENITLTNSGSTAIRSLLNVNGSMRFNSRNLTLTTDAKNDGKALLFSQRTYDTYANLAALPETGSLTKIYYITDIAKYYIWNGTGYAEFTTLTGSHTPSFYPPLYGAHYNLRIIGRSSALMKYGIYANTSAAMNATTFYNPIITAWYKRLYISNSSNIKFCGGSFEGDYAVEDNAPIYVADASTIKGLDFGSSLIAKPQYKGQPCYIVPIAYLSGDGIVADNVYQENIATQSGSRIFTYDDGVHGVLPIFCATQVGTGSYTERDCLKVWTVLYDPNNVSDIKIGKKSNIIEEYKKINYEYERSNLIKNMSNLKGATSFLKQIFFDKDGNESTLTNRGSVSGDANILNNTVYNQANKMSASESGMMKLLNFANSAVYGNFFWNLPDSDELSFGDGSTDSPFSISWCGVIPATLANTHICSKLDTTTGSPQREYEIAYFGTGNIRVILWDNSTGGSLRWQSVAGVITANSKISLVVTYDPTASPLHQGIKVFLNGTELTPDSNSMSGSYTAMENTTAVVGDYYLDSSGNKAWSFLGKVGYLDIRSGILTSNEIKYLDALLRNFMGEDIGDPALFGLTTESITESTDKNYITDTEKTVIGNISGTNTGDETQESIKTKLGSASTSTDGYLTSTDWNTFNGKQSALGYTPEDVSNKVTSISISSTDTEYPSAKCIYDIVGDITSALDTINGEVI